MKRIALIKSVASQEEVAKQLGIGRNTVRKSEKTAVKKMNERARKLGLDIKVRITREGLEILEGEKKGASLTDRCDGCGKRGVYPGGWCGRCGTYKPTTTPKKRMLKEELEDISNTETPRRSDSSSLTCALCQCESGEPTSV